MTLVIVGDALLDRDLDGTAERLAPDVPVPIVDAIEEHPRPGGAGLAAALAAGAGEDVTLVCALGDDGAGRRVAALLEDAGVRVIDLGLDGTTPEKVRIRAAGRSIVRLDAGAAHGCGRLTGEAAAALGAADAVLVSDYGHGVPAEPTVRATLVALPTQVPVVWDPHTNGPAPVPGVLLATPNEAEAQRLVASEIRGLAGWNGSVRARGPLAAAEVGARALLAQWQAVNVCVTRGAAGAVLVGGGGPALAVPAPRVGAEDPCGAGDCFAMTAAARLAHGALPSEAVRAAVHAASAFVAAGGAAGAAAAGFAPPRRSQVDAVELAARVRGEGGTVVATGGCFDLLHAGHVRMLEAARALGDCLVVCLNSDVSVRRLKGADRPLVGQDDRAAVLAGLGCVDAVMVFEEDDPRAALRELRPHVWAKGGDYALADLPEAEVMEEWGGRAVIVPYVSGRSTTKLIDEVVARAR